MKVETKYSIGDEVWCIHNHKACKCRISKVRMEYTKYYSRLLYYLTYTPIEAHESDILSCCTDINEPYFENLLFPTKEELLKSL